MPYTATQRRIIGDILRLFDEPLTEAECALLYTCQVTLRETCRSEAELAALSTEQIRTLAQRFKWAPIAEAVESEDVYRAYRLVLSGEALWRDRQAEMVRGLEYLANLLENELPDDFGLPLWVIGDRIEFGYAQSLTL